MISSFERFRQQIDEAINLIDDANKVTPQETVTPCEISEWVDTTSLLARCEVMCAKHEKPKPTLRIVHHFACSGGTLISKCIAAQPNVFLLSELHPTTGLGRNALKAEHTPRDIITQAFYGRLPDFDRLAEKLFTQGIIATEKHVRERGGYLVIRAHTHADYCTANPMPEVETLTRLLSPYFDIKHLVTVRNPIDSFKSLQENNWVHFQPNSFDEYCVRLLKFLEQFKEKKIMKYEDFVEHPERNIRTCLDLLELPACDHGLDYIDIFQVSGDSGRSGSIIAPRKRKDISFEYLEAISKSTAFQAVQANLKYNGA